MKVYVLQHEHELDGVGEVKLIGVYASEQEAEAAKARAIDLPGFSDTSDGFSIDRYQVGQDHWTGGFATERWSDGEGSAEKAA